MTETLPRLVHGLAGNRVAADWPPLGATEVARIGSRYPDVGAPVRIVWRSERPFSAAAVIQSAHGRFFLKRHHHTVRTVPTLQEEHRFIAHLRTHGAPVPAVLADAAGATVATDSDWIYELHACAHGVDLYRDSMSWMPITEPRHARAAGRALAHLHRAASGYAVPQRGTHILVARSEVLAAADPVATLTTQLVARPGLADYLQRHDWQHDLAAACGPEQAAFHARIATRPPVWTHGDWHVSNLCWSGRTAGARVTAVLDFGLAARNDALFDLATAIERNAIAWLALDQDAARVPIARELIAGYREVRALTTDDVALLAELLPRVHIDYALSEVEYYHAVTHADANADVAYGTFLKGHAAWFRTPAGRAMLDGIRACA